MSALIHQIRFMIRDAWQSRGRRSQINWDDATALRHSARPSGAARGAGAGHVSNQTYEMAAEAKP